MTPDPVVVARVAAEASARIAHHEAAHAVAVVARGGVLVDVFLGSVEDWTALDDSGDTPGHTKSLAAPADQPFVTFAGPWAEAQWYVEHDPELGDLPEAERFAEAMDWAWEHNSDGDTAKYEAQVATLEGIAAHLGLHPVGRAWEYEWREELDELWPVIHQVAEQLLAGAAVTTETVKALINQATV